MKDQPTAMTTGSPAVQGQHQRRGGAVVHLGHAGHDARRAERQQRAGQAEQFVGARPSLGVNTGLEQMVGTSRVA